MKTTVKIIAAVALTAASVQIAAAGDREHRALKRSQAQQSQQLRDSNAYYAPAARDGGYVYNDRLQSLYQGGAVSAPAGR